MQYMSALAPYNLDPEYTNTAAPPNTLANYISRMSNDGKYTALLVLHMENGTNITNEVDRFTLIHCVGNFEIRFGQLATQQDGCLFTSYGEVFHIQIGMVDLLSYFMDEVNTVQSI